MKKRIKHLTTKARPYARYVVVGLTILLFLSVLKASIFEEYLFSYSKLPSDPLSQEAFLRHVLDIKPEAAKELEGASFVKDGEKILLEKEGVEIAELELEESLCYLTIGGERLLIGGVSKQGEEISISEVQPESEKIWFEISFILLLAISAELLVIYLKQPTVMILLMLGILISPSAVSFFSPYISAAILTLADFFGFKVHVAETIPHLIPTEGVVEIFAQLGAIFLLFKVGLHSEIQKIFNGKNFFVAFMGIILPFLGGYLYADMTGHGFGYAMFLGAALTATSVGVTVAVLNEFGVLDREFSKIILGAAVIDDILSLLVLSLVKNFPTSLDLQTMTPFLMVIATALIFVVGGIKVGQRIVARYFNTPFDGCNMPTQTFLGVLVYLLSYAYVAEFIGLSAIVGAFLAGVTLNYSRIIHRIVEAVYPLEALFTPIFFISLGMFVDINALFQSFWPIIIITVIAILTKVVACGFAAKLIKSSNIDSLIVGVGMVPRGEVALIIGLVGYNAGLLHQTEYSIIASMAFLTTVIIPVMLQKALSAKKEP